MRTCYLHFGMPKTGSTAIQKALRGYQDETVSYAHFKGANHGLPLITAFSKAPEKYYLLKNAGIEKQEALLIGRQHKATLEEISSGKTSTVFSSEGVPDHLSPEGINALIEFMKSKYDNVQVIMYLRPIASLASSQFQERIKSGLAIFKLPAPDYKKRMLPVINSIGRENVQFCRYSRSDLYQGDIVQDFIKKVGIVLTDRVNDVDNVSLSAEAIARIFLFNKYLSKSMSREEGVAVRNVLKHKLMEAGAQKFSLHSDLIEKHVMRHLEDIEWAENIAGFDLHGEVKSNEFGVKNERTLLKHIDLRPIVNKG